MSFSNKPEFRGESLTAVERTADGIRWWFRDVKRAANGEGVETVRVLDPVDLIYARLSDAVRTEGFGYGMEVRGQRQMALSMVTTPGGGKRHPTASEKRAELVELVDHYMSGTESWTLAAGGGGSLSADTRALILAVQRALGLEAGAAEEAVRGMSTADRDALRVDAEIKPHLDAVYAERAKGATGTDALKEKLRALRG